MFEVEVWTSKGEKIERILCQESSCFIGKGAKSLVRLHGWRVGARHAEICEEETGELYVLDQVDGGGTFVNDEKISKYGPLKNDDEIRIQNFIIKISPIVPDEEIVEGAETPPIDLEKMNNKVTSVVPSKFSSEIQSLYKEWQLKIHEQLLQQMDLRRLDVHKMSDEELRALTQKILDEVISKNKTFPNELDKQELSKRALAEAVGLGPLEELLDNDDISEIMVNSSDDIFYEEKGRLYKSDVTFSSDRAVIYAIERIVTPLGRRIDESSPMVDARLRDGSRVNAIIPPLALKGPSITIRKFMKQKLYAHDVVNFGSATKGMMEFIEMAVKHRQNMIVSGGTGSGKTTLLNILSNYIPNGERIVTIEDSAELKLSQPNLVSLESRPPNQEGKGEVSIRDLVKNSLRMRPDRIVVGECRGGEALDMMQAMNTGHDGSMTTLHANSAIDCLSRLEVLVLMAELDLPSRAIREQIASSVDLVIQQTRFPCGSRKISGISEITGIDNEKIQMGEIFRYVQTGYDEKGIVDGYYEATGLIPSFYDSLRKKGVSVDIGIFEKRDI